MQTGSAPGAGLVIGVLEDNDDNDDTAIGNCDWVLSFKDKSKLNSLVFKPAAEMSTPPRALIGASVKTGGEKKQLMLMQQHFAQLLHQPEANFIRQKTTIAFCGRSCCCNCCCNCTLHMGCNFYRIKTTYPLLKPGAF
jgi:hypothetical protein